MHLGFVVPPSLTAGSAARYRTTPRNTTHHKDLPKSVTIIRPHHPFEGKELVVFGRQRHRGKLHWVLVLPDGSRSLIPQAWTDLARLQSQPQTKPNTTLASIHDLLHARAVVDALLHRRSSAPSSTPADPKSVRKERSHRATPAELSQSPHSGNSSVGNVGGATTRPRDRGLGATDRQSNARHKGRKP